MLNNICKYLLTVAINMASFILLQAQTRVDSVSFNDADMSGGAMNKTIKIGFDNCSGTRYKYNSLKLYTYLHLGKDYKYGNSSFNGTVTLKVDYYNTTSGSSGKLTTNNIVLSINENAPEQVYFFEPTN